MRLRSTSKSMKWLLTQSNITLVTRSLIPISLKFKIIFSASSWRSIKIRWVSRKSSTKVGSTDPFSCLNNSLINADFVPRITINGEKYGVWWDIWWCGFCCGVLFTRDSYTKIGFPSESRIICWLSRPCGLNIKH